MAELLEKLAFSFTTWSRFTKESSCLFRKDFLCFAEGYLFFCKEQ